SATNANVEILQAIAESLVIISIDEESKDSQETIRNLMLGENNKYFDKTIQIIITKQNELGFNIEHCAVDGTSISAVISHVSKGLKEEIPRNLRPSAKPIVKKLTWKLDKETQSILKQCQKEHGQQKNNYHLQSTIFTDFGA